MEYLIQSGCIIVVNDVVCTVNCMVLLF